MNTSTACLQINQGVRKVVLSGPYCESLYTYALHVIQAGEQLSVECQKSCLIPIPLLSLVYDHDSQYYSPMSIVKNIDLAYQYWTSYKSIHSELIRFQAFQVTAPGFGARKFYHGFSAIRSLLHHIHCISFNVHLKFKTLI